MITFLTKHITLLIIMSSVNMLHKYWAYIVKCPNPLTQKQQRSDSPNSVCRPKYRPFRHIPYIGIYICVTRKKRKFENAFKIAGIVCWSNVSHSYSHDNNLKRYIQSQADLLEGNQQTQSQFLAISISTLLLL